MMVLVNVTCVKMVSEISSLFSVVRIINIYHYNDWKRRADGVRYMNF